MPSACVPLGDQPSGSHHAGSWTYTLGPAKPGGLSVADTVGVSVDPTVLGGDGRESQSATITLHDLRLTAKGKVELKQADVNAEGFAGQKVELGFTVPPNVMADMNWLRPPNPLEPTSIPEGGSVTLDQTTYDGLGVGVNYRRLRLSGNFENGVVLSTAITRLSRNRVRVLTGPKTYVDTAISLGFGTDDYNISLVDRKKISWLHLEQADFDLSTRAGRVGYLWMAIGRIRFPANHATVAGTDYAYSAGTEIKLGKVTLSSVRKWSDASQLITTYPDGRQTEEASYRRRDNTMTATVPYPARGGGSWPQTPDARSTFQLRLRNVAPEDLQTYNAGYANRRGVGIDHNQDFVLNLTHNDIATLRQQSLEILAHQIRMDRTGAWKRYPEFRGNVSAVDVRRWIIRMRASGSPDQYQLEGIRIADRIQPYFVYIAPDDAAVLSQIFYGPPGYTPTPKGSLLWLRDWADAVAVATGNDRPGPGHAVCRGTVAATAPPPTTHHCPDVGFTPNSDFGMFEIKASGISCAQLESMLRKAGPNKPITHFGWHCRRTRTNVGPALQSYYRCEKDTQWFTWVTG